MDSSEAPARLADARLAPLREQALEGDYDFAAMKSQLGTAAGAPVRLAAKIGAGTAGLAIVVVAVALLQPPATVAPAAVVEVAEVAEVARASAPAVVDIADVADVAPEIAPAAAAAPRVRAPAPSTLAAEIEHYERGMVALADARFDDAIALFDEHRARWPRSQLRPEVSVSKLEALLRGKRDAAARALGAQLLLDDTLSGRHREIRAALEREENGSERELHGEPQESP